MTPEQRAERRQQALQRLEATRSRLAVARAPQAPPQPGSSSSNPPAGSNAIAASNRNAHRKQETGLLAKPYIEYDFSTMKDSKGGYLQPEPESTERWLDKLPDQMPVLPLDDPNAPACFECGTKEIDFRLFRVFGTRVCPKCRKDHPDKYSLLTKTECRQDYLLTDPELRDEELLPHLERPNPYQATYSNMMLYMRYQAEEYSFKKWGGPEGLDAEYERREAQKADRKRAKFERKIRDIRNKTRAQAITKVAIPQRHVHEWGDPEPQADGTVRRTCECGMHINEISI